ncbi:RimJ/RimL family protein N-acetyltransferase [Pseudomonas duriflava]|uniref:RimJ/RimL family protein N-acetyltransferase n=1 Tax=Pseudomonas duriflava TaxID=459528 RepID=A0A562PTW4_9PSED|nr:GNAT family protein [Pseudomonas duriflava]TWI47793.1 RimJ/RimL family protein N-acetyltransferase [Pseudomonas duriflava]
MTNTTALLHWRPVPLPEPKTLEGYYICLEPLDAQRQGDDFWITLHGPKADPDLWDFLPYGPFSSREAFNTWLTGHAASTDPLFFAVIDSRSGQAQGLLSLMSIVPEHGSIEIGHVIFGRAMQRTPRATEAVYLLAREAFALGYRRLEWKCDDRNERSRRAAKRFGFSYEGLFRQHRVVKNQSRNTAWFSLLDKEWPECRQAFETWLSPDNFDAHSNQQQRLKVLRMHYRR